MVDVRVIFDLYVGERKVSCCSENGVSSSDEIQGKGLRAKLVNLVHGENARFDKTPVANKQTIQKVVNPYLSYAQYTAPQEENFKGSYEVRIRVENIKD